MTDQSNNNGVPDFTRNEPPVQFGYRGETFNAPRRMSPLTLTKLAEMKAKLPDDLTALTESDLPMLLGVIADAFRAFVPGEGGQRLAHYLMDDSDPMDLVTEAMPIFTYLSKELLGGRPLAQAEPSSDGGPGNPEATPGDATSSTDGASPAASANMI